MTPRIPKAIPKEGKVWRLTKESWDALTPFDSDPNVAISKIVKALKERPGPAGEPKVMHGAECNFKEDRLKAIVKDSMEEVIRPFTGG
jgi:hypothetical protein